MRVKNHFAWGAAILVAAVAASLVAALPAQDSYCLVCGARQRTHPFGLRFTSLTLFRGRRVEPTPFSALLEQEHLVSAHQHRWQPPQLVPDPLNEFGPPVPESLEFINAPRVVGFMRNVADFADPVSVAKWKAVVLQPQYSYVIDGALRYLRVPPNGFADREQFIAWWGGNAYALSNRLREQTEPD